MRSTSRLLQHSSRLTLFTRSNCFLCDTAKATISKLQAKRTFEYREIDVMVSRQKDWKKAYEFDTPVLHVQRVFYTYSKLDIVTEARKLMHCFSDAEIEALMDEAQSHS